MVRGGENLVHKCAGIASNWLYFPLPKEKQENHKLSDRKQGRLVLLSKKRGETKYEHMIKFSQEV